MTPASAPSTLGKVFVSRQPILDRSGRVFGYDLRHQQSERGTQPHRRSADEAAAEILTDALLAIGLDVLTAGRRAFVRVSQRFLLEGVPATLQSDRVIIELGADVDALNADVVTACERLRSAGYALALDHDASTRLSPLLPLASFVRVDFTRVPAAPDRKRLFPAGLPSHVAGIAAHVEQGEHLAQAIAEGFTYFQGFYFGRPIIKSGSTVPPHQVAQLRLLSALNDPDLSALKLEELVKPDPAMCYRILRAVNSAGSNTRATVQSIGEALVLLGRDTIRRWASLWLLASLGQDAHSELLAMACVRARTCELLAGTVGGPDAGAAGFLTGMCSLLDSILGQPMAAVVDLLPLPADVKQALLGQENMQRHVFDAVVAYEWGDWERAAELAELAGTNATAVSGAYASALSWAYELRRG
jgi:EAL and modified HD-GYP domain-containing signal transduction protein